MVYLSDISMALEGRLFGVSNKQYLAYNGSIVSGNENNQWNNSCINGIIMKTLMSSGMLDVHVTCGMALCANITRKYNNGFS